MSRCNSKLTSLIAHRAPAVTPVCPYVRISNDAEPSVKLVHARKLLKHAMRAVEQLGGDRKCFTGQNEVPGNILSIALENFAALQSAAGGNDLAEHAAAITPADALALASRPMLLRPHSV